MNNFAVEEFALAPDDYWGRVDGNETAWRIRWVRLRSGEVIRFEVDPIINTFATKPDSETVARMFITAHSARLQG